MSKTVRKWKKSRRPKISQAQADIAAVQGWIAAAHAAREPTMVAFYERLLAALESAAPGSLPAPEDRPQ